MTQRYTLHAYVCGRSCVHRPEHDGAMTFAQILIERPNDCRYAVVGDDAQRVLVWDLYDAVVHPVPLEPTPLRVLTDVDQAIVSTLMLYNHEEE